jgi:hypothetical protein
MLAYRWLLRLCPASLREEYGDEMTATFARELAGQHGAARLVRLLAGFADLVASAAQAHADMAVQDVRDAVRTCRRNRGYAAAVVAVSALGVGAATAAFSLTDHVLVRPLPFAEPERLVKLWQDKSHAGYSRMELSPGNYEDWKRQATRLASMAAFTSNSVNAVTDAGPIRFDVTYATASLFTTLQVSAAIGRTFVDADETPGHPERPRVAIGVRRPSRHPRHHHVAERHAARGRRRDAARLRFSETRHRHVVAAVVRRRRPRGSQQRLSPRHRTPGTRRRHRRGPRRIERHRRRTRPRLPRGQRAHRRHGD